MHAATRLVAIVLLVGLTFGAGIHYDTAYESHWPYPTDERIATDYDRHVGDRTLLFGTVTAVEGSSTLTVSVESDEGTFTLTTSGVAVDVRPGGTLQLYGTLRPGHRMAVERAVVVNPGGGSVVYKYAVSIVGALLVLAVFGRSWRLDVDRLRFERREREGNGAGDGVREGAD